MNDVNDFLLKNGFRKTSDVRYDNDNCHINVTNILYHIHSKVGVFRTSDFYGLIGRLTYFGLIDKNYIQ
jgi:hypothetical protein